jgi:hypothetical protein
LAVELGFEKIGAVVAIDIDIEGSPVSLYIQVVGGKA